MSVLGRWFERAMTPEAAIVRDIDDELRSHLELAEAAHREGGADAEASHRAAVEEFGDPEAHRRACLRAALAPRRQLRLSVGAVGAAVMLFAAGGYLDASARLRTSQEQLSRISAEVEGLRSSLAAVRGGETVPLAQTVHFITVEGAVEKPRMWTLPRNSAPTLRQLIQRSGGLADDATGRIVVSRLKGREVVETLVIEPGEWMDPGGLDPVLEGFFHVVAVSRVDSAASVSGGSGSPPA